MQGISADYMCYVVSCISCAVTLHRDLTSTLPSNFRLSENFSVVLNKNPPLKDDIRVTALQIDWKHFSNTDALRMRKKIPLKTITGLQYKWLLNHHMIIYSRSHLLSQIWNQTYLQLDTNISYLFSTTCNIYHFLE